MEIRQWRSQKFCSGDHDPFGLTLAALLKYDEAKERKRENGETMSVFKAQVTICPDMNFAEGKQE